MKKSAFFLFLILTVHHAFPQAHRLDSLMALLAHAKEDTVKVNLLSELSNTFANIDSANYFARVGLKLADSLGFEKGVVIHKLNLAFAAWASGDFPTAIQFGYSLLESPIVKNNDEILAPANAVLAISYRDIGDPREAMKWIDTIRFKKGINFAALGSCYYELGEYDSALLLLKRSLRFAENRGFAGWIYLIMGRTSEKMNDVSGANEYYHKSIRGLSSEVNLKDLSGAYSSIGSFFLNTGRTDSAIYFGKKAVELARTRKFKRELIGAYVLLARIYERLQSPNALKYYKLSIAVKDSLYTQQRQRQIAGYKFSEQLKLNDLERARATYENEFRIRTLVGITFTLLVIALFLYRSSRQKQKAKQKIEQAYDQLKNAQAQLIQSEKMASLGELTAGIAHEIQNPLNFVNNFSEVNTELISEMKTEIEKENYDSVKALAKDIEDNQRKINHHGNRADAIVKGMLQHSRTSSGIKEPTDINALADEFLRLAYHGLRAKDKSFNAKTVTDFDESIGDVNVIPQDVGRVILNLITNAFYAVIDKKNRGAENYEPTVSISTRRERDKVSIVIKDNGTGIPQNALDKIFQPFFTTKPTGQGTGLGLSLSYDIVKAHQGELQAKTTEGEGSEFIIILPI